MTSPRLPKRAPKPPRDYDCANGCPVEATLDLIDGKWKGVILYHLQDGPVRFNALRRGLPGITQRMLTKQLRELEQGGLILRQVFAEVPPRVEYRLSPLGETMQPVIETLKSWGETYLKGRKRGETGPIQAVPAGEARV